MYISHFLRIGSLLVASTLSTLVAGCATNDVTLGGPSTLIRVVPLLPGAECKSGGSIIYTGLDNDGDTFLDDAEITSSQNICNGDTKVRCQGGVVRSGTVTARNAADLQGLEGVNCVDGDLLITGVDRENLSSLKSLGVVTGELVIVANPGVTSLAGLDELAFVGGTFLVQANEQLVSLVGISKFTNSSTFAVVGNPMLTSMKGLERFNECPGNLRIVNNDAMTSLQGLENLEQCNESIAITGNNSLPSLTGLDALRSVVLIEVSSNKVMQSVALPTMQRITSRLIVTDNPAATSLSVPALVTVGNLIQIDNNPALQAIAMPTLLTSPAFFMSGNSVLSTLSLPSLTFLTSNLSLRSSTALESISMPKLVSVGGDFTVDRVGKLRDFSGLPTLRSIGGNLNISNNAGMTDAIATAFAATLDIAGTVTIKTNGM
jgi:hypothetical protein